MHDLKRPSIYEKTIKEHQITTCVSKVFHENCYIVGHIHSKKAQIIDPGDSYDLIDEQIQLKQLQPVSIFLTHSHFDHMLSAYQLAKKFNIPVFVSKKDYKLLRRAPLYAFRFTKQQVNIPEVIFYEDAEQGQLLNINVINTPGHTEGSVCIDYGNFAFAGDTIFFEHLGPTNYPESNLNDLFISVEKILQLNENAFIFSGHGRPWKIADAKIWFESLDKTHPPQYLIMNDPSLQAKGMKA